jgi:hypothetical protein
VGNVCFEEFIAISLEPKGGVERARHKLSMKHCFPKALRCGVSDHALHDGRANSSASMRSKHGNAADLGATFTAVDEARTSGRFAVHECHIVRRSLVKPIKLKVRVYLLLLDKDHAANGVAMVKDWAGFGDRY